jgi:hypothetical protein
MYNFFKRLGDIILSGFAILVLSPLLIPVMIILKCTGEHDIFYGQDRIGYKNKHFKILKFATMLRNSPNMAGGLHTTHGDPRVLPFGRFLRKTKINELPQLKLIASHDLDFIWDTCSRTILIDGGRIVRDGPTEEIMTDGPLLDAHGLELPLSLSGRHRRDSVI